MNISMMDNNGDPMEEYNYEIIYNRFKNILSGCKTFLDAYQFADRFIKKYPYSKEIIHTMIQSKTYESTLDFRSIKNTLEELNTCIYREDVDEMINKISKQNVDSTQLKSLMRISKIKSTKPIKIEKDKMYGFKDDIKNDLKHLIKKKCPHCDTECIVDKESDYIVCGYYDTHSGYDWVGCGKDWCFKCGKMLCKEWKEHQLFVESNRFHDYKCCELHAKENNLLYPDDYCQCMNKFVKRIK